MKKIWSILGRAFKMPSIERTHVSGGMYTYGRDFSRFQYEQQQRWASNETGEKIPPSDQLPTYRIPNLKTFTEGVQACPPEYYSDTSLTPKNITHAFALYEKAWNRPKDLNLIILGRLPLAKKGKDGTIIYLPSNEDYPSIDEAMKKNFLTADEDPTTGNGNILQARDWIPLLNDSWTLGGNNQGTTFHLASNLSLSNLLTNDEYKITVMARELVSLLEAGGYDAWKPHLKLETVLIRTDLVKAEEASLYKYSKVVQEYENPDKFEKFFYSLPREVRK